MSETLRDRVRLRWPRALGSYQRHVAPRLRRDRRTLELAAWVSSGVNLVGRLGAHGVRFERDGVWIDDGDGCLWSYEPGPFSSTLWAEFGVRYERAEIDVLAELLADGGTLVDVGANIGLHSVTLARRLPRLSVLAFEPVAGTFALLGVNTAKNKVSDQITLHHLALSDHPGILSLTTRYQAGNFVVPAGVASQETEQVRCERLDDVLSGSDVTVTAIKCDVEGAEFAVLRGAVATIERDRPAILIELDRRWAARYGHTPEQVVTFLTDLGYRCHRFVEGRLEPGSAASAADDPVATNYLFTHGQRLTAALTDA